MKTSDHQKHTKQRIRGNKIIEFFSRYIGEKAKYINGIIKAHTTYGYQPIYILIELEQLALDREILIEHPDIHP
jgi:hypothetical protein